MLPPRSPAETVCHGDFAPYNCVFRGGKAVAVIDFEAAHPGPRSWDIAYALYRFAPFTAPGNPDGFGSPAERARRARLFCDAYGLAPDARERLPGEIADRLQALVDLMLARAAAGDPKFTEDVRQGHADLYRRDIAHIRRHAPRIREALRPHR
ncbi:phosphotransferase [Nocardiopsis potens]|uniref:phosphotransferase n=1 Tax=Nocardiopsis potens TaxID=1246458 RepID=UPI000347BBB3|nr:phosphotransferase [Nocardiopsis potens]